MDDSDEPSPSEPGGGSAAPASAAAGAPVKRWKIPKLPLLIGAIGLGAMVTTGTMIKRQDDARERIAVGEVRVEVKTFQAAAAEYRSRMATLRWTAGQYRANVKVAEGPLKPWAQQRAMLFEAFLAEIERQADEKTFERISAEIDGLCARGEVTMARVRLAHLPRLRFPEPKALQQMKQENYFAPLAQFSRQSPTFYRALQEFERETSEADVATLRSELTAAGIDTIKPQTLLGFELLGAVVPATDPLLADWTTLVSAPDFFDGADAETLGRWRAAQKAVRAEDWPTAVALMQAIARATVRTHQPFRAAYGRAILRNTPEDTATAYPFMQEAALAGDTAARAWISQDNFSKGKHGDALPWLEARATDGEADALPSLLEIYAMTPEAVPRDAARELATLEKITMGPDTSPQALALLARLYESGRVEKSPEKAFVCYQRAAEKRFAPAWMEVARCHFNGEGTAVNLDAARDWAGEAYAAGERERSVPMLIELMRKAPDQTAPALQQLFERESVVKKEGFADTRIGGPGVTRLKTMLARYFDRKGQFAAAAQFYANSGNRDAAIVKRHAELTTAHSCRTCGGGGKIHGLVACANCGGKGTVVCSVCDGRGYSLKSGAPPCTTCGGSGGMVQDGRAVACSACTGTGKGKGSVTKQPCMNCSSGRMPCRDCTGGRIKVTKECATCRGKGSRALADD